MQPSSELPTNIPDLTSSLFAPDPIILLITKLSFLLVAVMYVVYSIVLTRQVRIMNGTVATSLGPVIQLIAWINLAFSLVFTVGIVLFL
ncbi:hypothetical protein KA012_04640 [Candidatus Woesebacteria bacterium]|nr:hypothetical protein [Candidatus Woesebacteria bacterium]